MEGSVEKMIIHGHSSSSKDDNYTSIYKLVWCYQ
jgi:hypothetical protein